jgi:hypothetical protein
MPEIKHSFHAGRMNKDADERLVPNGEYRDAMNIQVKTTDGSDIGIGDAGSAQNIKGNKLIASAYFENGYVSNANTGFSNTTDIVASIADEKNNAAYFFVAAPILGSKGGFVSQITQKKIFIDSIIEVKETISGIDDNPVVIDKWAIAVPNSTSDNIFGPFGPTGGWGQPYIQLNILDAASLGAEVGMKVLALKSNGANMLDKAEIQSIDDNVITLYSEQTANLSPGGDCVALIFKRKRVLNFEKGRLITGINIIDDLLFWTDNYSEPKKINIKRCKEGCATGDDKWTTHTKLKFPIPSDPQDEIINFTEFEEFSGDWESEPVTLSPSVNDDLKEEHITVMKQAPLTAPNLELKTKDRDGLTSVSIYHNFTDTDDDNNTSVPQLGGELTIINSALNGIDYRINDIIIFTNASDSTNTLKFTVNNKFVPDDGSGDTQITIMLLSASGSIPTENIYWDINLQQGPPLFELKMCRFGYRYRYTDGEYSSFSPWSEIAFLPGTFNYEHKRGYNLGMVNTVRQVIIKDFIPHVRTRPSDIVAVDILYKATDSPNVYVVKTIERERDPEWEMFTPGNFNNTGVNSMTFGKFAITSEMIHKAIPSNQILRAWDNIPRYSLAQEITANRLIYGNYTQGYDINSPVGLVQSIKSYSDATTYAPKKSIKSIREYKFGMVFGDIYGRETPVIAPGFVTGDDFSNYNLSSGDVRVPKTLSYKNNTFELQQDWDQVTGSGVPEMWMDYVKYYVKETSNEYYNLIMDRWYYAEDGNVWISFPSAERNKVDEETYLILKNEHGNNTPVLEKARYKIVSIENEVPEFIKTDKRSLGRIRINDNYEGLWLDTGTLTSNSPDGLMKNTEIVVPSGEWQGKLDQFQMKGGLKISIIGKITNGEIELKSREVALTNYHEIDGGGGTKLHWSETFDDEADMYSKFVAQGESSPINNIEYYLEITEHVPENKPEYTGKFFVKLEKDLVLEQKVLNLSTGLSEYIVEETFPLAYVDSQPINPALNGTYADYSWGSGTIGTNTNSIDNVTGLNRASTPIGLNSNNPNDVQTCQWMGVGGTRFNWNNPSYPFWFDEPISSATFTRAYWEWYKTRVEPSLFGSANAINSPMFIDSARGRRIIYNVPEPNTWEQFSNDDGDIQRNVNYYKPTGLDQGYLNGDGFGPTSNTFGRMCVSVRGGLGSGDFGGPKEQLFKENFIQPNTIFRFVSDPDPNRYYITVSSPEQVDQITGSIGYASNYSRTSNYNTVAWPGGPEGVVSGEYSSDGAVGLFSNDTGWEEVAVNTPNFSMFTDDANDMNFTDNDGDNTSDFNWSEDVIGISGNAISGDGSQIPSDNDEMDDHGSRRSIRFEFRKLDENGVAMPNVGLDPEDWDPRGTVMHDGRNRLGISIVKKRFTSGGKPFIPSGETAVWETEPKESVDIDLYYEVSNSIPMKLTSENTPNFAPYNSKITLRRPTLNNGIVDVAMANTDHHVWTIGYTADTSIIGIRSTDANGLIDLHKADIGVGDYLVFHHNDGTKTTSQVTRYMSPLEEYGDDANLRETVFTPANQTEDSINISLTYAGYSLDTGVPVILVQNYDGSSDVPSGVLSVGQQITGENTNYDIPDDVFITSIQGANNNYITVSNWSWLDVVVNTGGGYDQYKNLSVSTATGYYEIVTDVWKYPVELAWFNCYSFGNGVESDRIRDDFNAPQLDNGAVVSSIFLDYGEEVKGSSMIYSGLYNSLSGVNNLNEFNMAEKITKDLNPVYGSIQALKTRDTDVVVLTEDKVLKVTTNKDALFNADGNPQLMASNKVLGTAIPFVGDYGISKNPESLASDQYRLYFTDKQRGAVMRLSRDGLTPISNIGMRTWFRENLNKTDSLLGTFDKISGEYNLTLDYKYSYDATLENTLSFNESSNGWVSFKSFHPRAGVSVGGKYLTGINSDIYEHHVDTFSDSEETIINNRNTFYGNFKESTITVLFNDMPGSIKNFKTLNYEGSQAKIIDFTTETVVDTDGNTLTLTDNNYYNLTPKNGWAVDSFITDLQKASIPEFIKKENKWFNKIQGSNEVEFKTNSDEFTTQGIGTIYSITYQAATAFDLSVSADLIDDPTD